MTVCRQKAVEIHREKIVVDIGVKCYFIEVTSLINVVFEHVTWMFFIDVDVDVDVDVGVLILCPSITL